jgi:SprA-related family
VTAISSLDGSPAPGAAAPSTAKAVGSKAQADAKEQAVLAELAAEDQHVRAHEQAHLAAAGPYATGGASYTYTVGPDGNLYAVAGEVSLDVSPDPSDPEKTIQKAQVIQAAAEAPSDPSEQDRRVAAMAAQMASQAEQELMIERQRGGEAYSGRESPARGSLLSLIG